MNPISDVSSSRSALLEGSENAPLSNSIYQVASRGFEFIANIFSTIESRISSLLNRNVSSETYQCQRKLTRQDGETFQYNYTLSHENGNTICISNDISMKFTSKINLYHPVLIYQSIEQDSSNQNEESEYFLFTVLGEFLKPFAKSQCASTDVVVLKDFSYGGFLAEIKKTQERRKINGESQDVTKLSFFEKGGEQKHFLDIFYNSESYKILQFTPLVEKDTGSEYETITVDIE